MARRGERPPTRLLASSVPPPPPGDKDSLPNEFALFVGGWEPWVQLLVDWTPTIRAHSHTPLHQEPAGCDRSGKGTCGHPQLRDGEVLQGFPPGWTSCLPERRRFARIGTRFRSPFSCGWAHTSSPTSMPTQLRSWRRDLPLARGGRPLGLETERGLQTSGRGDGVAADAVHGGRPPGGRPAQREGDPRLPLQSRKG